jgi:hypothetical protein
MLLGIFFGGGLAVTLYGTTGNALFFSLAGIGLALGFGIGACIDWSTRFTRELRSSVTKKLNNSPKNKSAASIKTIYSDSGAGK